MFEPKITLMVENFDSDGKSQTVGFSGQLDKLGLEKIRGDLEKIIHETPADVIILDFKNLDFLNSESIGFLFGMYTHVKKKNKHMNIINMNSGVRDVLDTVGLLTLLAS